MDMKVDIKEQPTLRTPVARRQFVTPFPVVSDGDDVTRKLSAIRQETQRVKAERPEIAQDDSPYRNVQLAVLAIIMTTMTGIVLLATRHTDGFLYNTFLVALVLFSWSIIGYEFFAKQSFSYGLITANIVLIVLFLMAWFCLALVFVLPNTGLAPYLAVTPGPHPCPGHYLLRNYHHIPTCVELPLPKGVK